MLIKQFEQHIKLLEKIAPYIHSLSIGEFDADRSFKLTLRAAIAKSFEFATFVLSFDSDPFFVTATLRGICEDLIVITFLADLEDRDKIVDIISQKNMYEEGTKQVNFFSEQRPWQPVLHPPQSLLHLSQQGLDEITQKYGWKRGGIPSVYKMAKQANLESVYDFMYSATSKWVHYSPHILIRMGWWSMSDKSSNKETEFSTKLFKDYYYAFNCVYSTFLLVNLLKRFNNEFKEAGKLAILVNELDKVNEAILRWPELITNEELNREGIGDGFRTLWQAMAKMIAEEQAVKQNKSDKSATNQ